MAIEAQMASNEIRSRVHELVPQKNPFRFIDEILELSDKHIVGKYTFTGDEFFYKGHFPEYPITPGVILIETMAQTGVVAHGIYLALNDNPDINVDMAKQTMFTAFTEAEVEFTAIVKPGDSVIVRGELVFYRRKKIRSKVSMILEGSGKEAASGFLSGIGVEYKWIEESL